MSLTQILGHLRTGDVIIVRNGAASMRLRLPATPGRPDAVDVNEINSRRVLRSLIAVRKAGGKK